MNYNNIIKYILFKDEQALDLVEVEETDDIIPIGKFFEDCIYGCLSDYDGEGYFVKTINGKDYAITDIDFSIDEDEVYYKRDFIGSIFYFCQVFKIKKVVWFNK